MNDHAIDAIAGILIAVTLAAVLFAVGMLGNSIYKGWRDDSTAAECAAIGHQHGRWNRGYPICWDEHVVPLYGVQRPETR